MQAQHLIQSIDLRRTDTLAHDEVTLWADFLADTDRAVLHSIFLHNMQIRSIAAAGKTSPDTLRKRIRRLLQRISSTDFQFVAKHLAVLPPPTKAIAQLCILQGFSISQAAQKLRLTPNYVRQHRRMAVPILNSLIATNTSGGA